MSELLPKLKPIMVDPTLLYLDPNNPRFITKESDRIPEENFLNSNVIKNTIRKMYGDKKDVYNIKQIIDSIEANGWQPVDVIFVRRFDENRFVVLEGNRRVTAIHAILEDSSTQDELREELGEIEVMEVTDKIDKRSPAKSERALRRKIAYLLGVRHHGSLKQWSPFAQGASIYGRYLAAANQTDATFDWNKSIAESIAVQLSMKAADVEERIRVYRAMKQIGEYEPVKSSEDKTGDEKGGMKDRYYSVCKEVLITRSKRLAEFIRVESDFKLDDTSLKMIADLCHFDLKGRSGSPINNPQQWRFLGKILDDENEQKRETNIERVVKGKERPENVWADREAELMQPEWSKWLNEVARIFDNLTFKDVVVDDESTEAMKRVALVLENLEVNSDV